MPPTRDSFAGGRHHRRLEENITVLANKCTKTAETEMEWIPEIINGVPNISGWEDWMQQTTARGGKVSLRRTPMRLERIQSAFAVALHMHQPIILYNHDLWTAPMVNILQYMME